MRAWSTQTLTARATAACTQNAMGGRHAPISEFHSQSCLTSECGRTTAQQNCRSDSKLVEKLLRMSVQSCISPFVQPRTQYTCVLTSILIREVNHTAGKVHLVRRSDWVRSRLHSLMTNTLFSRACNIPSRGFCEMLELTAYTRVRAPWVWKRSSGA